MTQPFLAEGVTSGYYPLFSTTNGIKHCCCIIHDNFSWATLVCKIVAIEYNSGITNIGGLQVSPNGALKDLRNQCKVWLKLPKGYSIAHFIYKAVFLTLTSFSTH